MKGNQGYINFRRERIKETGRGFGETNQHYPGLRGVYCSCLSPRHHSPILVRILKRLLIKFLKQV